jgi:hypothetical protein
MKKLIAIIVLFNVFNLNAQNKSGYSWIVGHNASFCRYDGSQVAPIAGQKFSITHPNSPMLFTNGTSNICDTSNGSFVILSNGMQVFDSLGYLIENGDSLQPAKIYIHNAYPNSPYTQGSLILPKGNNKEYYVFIPSMTDSVYDLYVLNPNSAKVPFDILRYNVVDMKLNGGSGKVVKKNRVLLKNVELSKVMMQACKHANGVDWWLLKHALDDNTIYRFLVTKDSVYGPFIQTFAQPKWGTFDLFGQSAFSKDGKKYGAVMGKSNKLFLADFDRCSGELNNPKVLNTPIDSTTWAYWDDQGVRDSLSNGICFSANNQFVYISKRWNIYQYELNQTDSSLAWYRVKHGTDTTLLQFEYYGQLYRAPNNRIYIGKIGGSFTQFSVIDNPDNKGVACNFCRKCFRIDTANGGLTSPPNMPDYELGPDTSKPCWPLSHVQVEKPNHFEIYPNPANSTIIVEYTCASKGNFELINSLGQVVLATELGDGRMKVQLNVHGLTSGMYYYKCSFDGCEDAYGKLIIE